MKLAIVIPALDEAQNLPHTLGDLPEDVAGFDELEVIVVDDGSRDRTSEVALEHGAQRVVRFPSRRGLAEAFAAGLDAGLRSGADVIVTCDADNQYKASEIPALVGPILRGEADIVVGERRGAGVAEFSAFKRFLLGVGSATVRAASRTSIPDAASGFRAYSREAALRVNVLGRFSYTLESLIQAGRSGLAVASVPVETNPSTRESRLFSSIPQYLWRSGVQMIRAYVTYAPLRTFVFLATVLLAAAFVLFGRFFYYYVSEGGRGHVQSLVLGSVLALAGVQMLAIGVLADLLAANRRLLERVLVRVRRIEIASGVADELEVGVDSDPIK